MLLMPKSIKNLFLANKTCLKSVRIDDKFSNPVVLYREENVFSKFIEAILKENEYCKQMKKHFDKNLVMSVEKKRSFGSVNKCWICNKLLQKIIK